MELRSIITLLKPTLSLSGSATLEQLPAGEINHVYKLEDGERQFAVKWIGEDHFSGIDRFHQFSVQEQLANQGLAPKPIWLSDDGRLWVEQWLVSQADEKQNEVQCLAQVLAKIHSVPITARPLELEQRWQHYISVAGLSEDSELVIRSQALKPVVREAARAMKDTVLCHNDLSLGHIVDTERMIVVDWEYSAMGNRYFDVASCALINGFNEEQIEKLCEHYAALTILPLEVVIENTRNQLKVVAVTNELWHEALLASEHNTLTPPVIM